jgi:hypothetical protein
MDEASCMQNLYAQKDLPEGQGDESKVFLAKFSIFICRKDSHDFIHHPRIIFHNSQSIRGAPLHCLSYLG